MKKLGLYIHIPFCDSKCAYCDFISFCGQEKKMEEYVEAVIGEMKLYKNKFAGKVFDTLYIGGGTPSVLTTHAVEKIVTAAKENFVFSCHPEERKRREDLAEATNLSFPGDCHAYARNDIEITIEVNPRSLTEDKLSEYLRVGVNRISLGVQCMNDAVLKTIGRVQTVADVEKAFALLSKLGVENISADLMLGLPNETYADVDNTLNFFATHGVKHISAYGLQVENGTPLARQIETGEISVPNEDETTNQYEYACARMRDLGFERYEISNFAKVVTNEETTSPSTLGVDTSPRTLPISHKYSWGPRGRQEKKHNQFWISKHNSKYWDGTEYLGLGVSASGYFDGVRYTNTKKLDEYINKISDGEIPVDYIETLSKEQRREERIMLALRTEKGLNLNEFKIEFGENLLKTKAKEIEKLVRAHMVEIVDNHLRIMPEQMYVSNAIILELI